MTSGFVTAIARGAQALAPNEAPPVILITTDHSYVVFVLLEMITHTVTQTHVNS